MHFFAYATTSVYIAQNGSGSLPLRRPIRSLVHADGTAVDAFPDPRCFVVPRQHDRVLDACYVIRGGRVPAGARTHVSLRGAKGLGWRAALSRCFTAPFPSMIGPPAGLRPLPDEDLGVVGDHAVQTHVPQVLQVGPDVGVPRQHELSLAVEPL